jgi:hypothetical protein
MTLRRSWRLSRRRTAGRAASARSRPGASPIGLRVEASAARIRSANRDGDRRPPAQARARRPPRRRPRAGAGDVLLRAADPAMRSWQGRRQAPHLSPASCARPGSWGVRHVSSAPWETRPRLPAYPRRARRVESPGAGNRRAFRRSRMRSSGGYVPNGATRRRETGRDPSPPAEWQRNVLSQRRLQRFCRWPAVAQAAGGKAEGAAALPGEDGAGPSGRRA